jgi:hypothetical protein
MYIDTCKSLSNTYHLLPVIWYLLSTVSYNFIIIRIILLMLISLVIVLIYLLLSFSSLSLLLMHSYDMSI